VVRIALIHSFLDFLPTIKLPNEVEDVTSLRNGAKSYGT
jgi:hypothetical protein